MRSDLFIATALTAFVQWRDPVRWWLVPWLWLVLLFDAWALREIVFPAVLSRWRGSR